MIMWTAEELGMVGARQYIQRHAAENGNLQFVMESDIGTFVPLGLDFTGGQLVKCILERIMRSVYCRKKVILLFHIIQIFNPN